MDLTQFDDASGSGRSVPVMPVTQTTPTISITEASPPRESSTMTAEQETLSQSEAHQMGQQREEQEPTAMSPQWSVLMPECFVFYSSVIFSFIYLCIIEGNCSGICLM